MTRERARAVVIGGGVIGCAVLHELVRHGVDGALLLEARSDVGEGTSKANSAIVHTGFDAKPGSLEAELLARARALWPSVIENLAVPFLPVGAVMLARSSQEAGRLHDAVAPAAEAAGVETTALDHAGLRELVPYVTDRAVAGLLVPDEGVIDPFWLTRAYAEAAVSGGAEVRCDRTVVRLEVGERSVLVGLEDGSEVEADVAFDCAGVRADGVAALAGDRSFAITPRKGQLLVSEEDFGVDRIILPLPTPTTKGMLVTPIVFGGLLLGPTAVDQEDKDDRGTDPSEAQRILEESSQLVPALEAATPLRAFAGLRTVSSTGDYIIAPSVAGERLWVVAGIRSTGISASPAVAEHAVASALARLRWPRSDRPNALTLAPAELPDDPGELVCLCRGISHAEVAAACRQLLAPRTIDAVKRRCGATFGHCQGSLCGIAVARILASERSVPVTDIRQSGLDSWLFHATASPPSASHPAAPHRSQTDVAVVGAGRAGRAAAAELDRLGLDSASLDHRRGRTAVGARPVRGGWELSMQGQDGTSALEARAVVIATGGYTEPRASRAIGGQRPAGIITAEYVERALEAGLVPGTVAVIVGTNGAVDDLCQRMGAVGMRVTMRLEREPDEILGQERVTAVRLDAQTVPCDTLVFADRRLPFTFLLADLGLVEPGDPAPAGPDGRLASDGLWATGCCRRPDPAHAQCAEDGRRVARAVAESLGGRRS